MINSLKESVNHDCISKINRMNWVQTLVEWPERCNYWLSQYQYTLPKRKRREREKAPLILTGQGLSIRIDKGRLIIRDGNTHYPGKLRQFEYFKGGLDIPKRIILLDGSGSITLDALDWLSEQDVTLVRLKWDGGFVSVVTTGGQAADLAKVQWQEDTRRAPDARCAYALGLIRAKVAATIETMETHVPRSKYWGTAMTGISAIAAQLEARPPASLGELLGAEGGAASHYFRAWRGLDMQWRENTQHPIPDEWRSFTSRSAVREGKSVLNRGATHPVSAMLNYAYGWLLSQTQIEAIAEGYDPTLGIVHDTRAKDRGRTPAFALDRMEPSRPVVDRAVLKLLREETFSGADFVLQSDGVVKLGPELARRVVGSTAG